MTKFIVSVVSAVDEGGYNPSLCMSWPQISDIAYRASGGNESTLVEDTLPDRTFNSIGANAAFPVNPSKPVWKSAENEPMLPRFTRFPI